MPKLHISFLCTLLLLLTLLGCGNNASVRPFVGGPYADFVVRYGEPYLTVTSTTLTGGQAMFTADDDSSIVFKVCPTSGNVSLLTATGPASWTDDEELAFCGRFLPKDATQTERATKYQTFHSSVGDLRLNLPRDGTGSCELTIVQLSHAPIRLLDCGARWLLSAASNSDKAIDTEYE